MANLLPDLRYALRGIRRAPLFTSVAILSLALGIGANTAIFTLMDQLMLRKLPIRAPEQLVMLIQHGPHNGSNMGSRMHSYPIYQDFQQKAEPFSEVICRRLTEASVAIDGHTERVDAEMVSGNYFSMLGVKAAAGRLFRPEEDDRVFRGHPVVVLSYDYWVTRFARDTNAIGKKILVSNYPMTIVGVSAPGFAGLDPAVSPQIRVPILMEPIMNPQWAWMNPASRRARWVQVFARLKPGYTAESAQPAVQTLFHQVREYEATLPEAKDWSAYGRERFLKEGTVTLEPAATGYSELRNNFSKALVVLMCMVGLVLLIACANVANLLIARALARQKEIAVRLSIGATRGDLVRQLLVESVTLSLIGGAVGVLLAFTMTRGLLALIPAEGNPLLIQPSPDLRILVFTLALTLATGLVFGLVPALRASRPDLWSTLKEAVVPRGGMAGSLFLRKGLVAAQVALSFMLLFGAGLFVRSLQNLRATNTGFRDMDNLITFQVSPSLNGYDDVRTVHFYDELLDRLRAVPGVKSASLAAEPVLHGYEWDNNTRVEGYHAKDGEDMQAFMNALSPCYFETMGTPLLEGRDFDRRDIRKDSKVAIVNEHFARHFFGDRSPIGRHLGQGRSGDKLDIEIVGMVADSLYEGPREGVRRQVFIPNWGNNGVAFYVRGSLQSSALYGAIRGEVKRLDPSMPVYELKTLGRQLDETLLTERLIALLSAGFGLLATLLATIGLYGVMAFVVARRTKELGLRMALGAARTNVVWLVMREVLTLLAIGLAVGIPAAVALGSLVANQLYGIQARDPWIAAGSVALLAAVGAVAGMIPATRASRIDPILALRYE
jgi:predicted permease